MSEPKKEGTTKCPYTTSKRLLERNIGRLFGRGKKREDAPSPYGFFRLTTSEGDVAANAPEGDKVTVREVGEYLGHVLSGGKDGKPLCPFVRHVHAQDGYRLTLAGETPDTLNFEQLALLLKAEFVRLSPQKTSVYQGLDVTTTVLAFSNPECRSAEFGERLESERNRLRQQFLDDGLMLAHMFDSHDDPKGTRSYQSRIPLLMVRRMHEPDHVFMHTDEEKAAYRKFFPASYPVGFGG